MMYFCINMSPIASWFWLDVTAYDMSILQDFSPPRIGSASGNYFPTIDHNKPVYIEESNASRRHAVVSCFWSQHVLFSNLVNLKVMYMVNYVLENIWSDCSLWTFEFNFWELHKIRLTKWKDRHFFGPTFRPTPRPKSELSRRQKSNLCARTKQATLKFFFPVVQLWRCIYLLRCWFRFSSFQRTVCCRYGWFESCLFSIPG